MRGYFWPNALLTKAAYYRAALHGDAAVARQAFAAWLAAFDPEAVIFDEHKLIGVAGARFPELVAENRHAGVISNIMRQARLRGHVAAAELTRLAGQTEFAGMALVALGETQQRLVLGVDAGVHMEAIELAVAREALGQAMKAAESAGYRQKRGARVAWGRGAEIAVMALPGLKTLELRLIGLNRMMEHERAPQGPEGVRVMGGAGYGAFMASRRVGLLRRRDQILFDIYAGVAGETAPKPVNAGFAKQMRGILGR